MQECFCQICLRLIGVCIGLTSIRFALRVENLNLAIIAIIFAALIDGLRW